MSCEDVEIRFCSICQAIFKNLQRIVCDKSFGNVARNLCHVCVVSICKILFEKSFRNIVATSWNHLKIVLIPAILIDHFRRLKSTAFAKPFSKTLSEILFEKLFRNVAGNPCRKGCGNSLGNWLRISLTQAACARLKRAPEAKDAAS